LSKIDRNLSKERLKKASVKKIDNQNP